MSVTTAICWPRQAQSALPSQRIPCLHTPLFAVLLSAHSEKQPHIFTPALKACLWERKPKRTATTRYPKHLDEGQYEFPWYQKELESFCLFSTWTQAPVASSSHQAIKLVRKEAATYRAERWEPEQKQAQPWVTETLASQVPVQPTGLSHLLPWVGTGHALSLAFVLAHAPKLPVTSWPRLSYTLNSLPNTSLLIDS